MYKYVFLSALMALALFSCNGKKGSDTTNATDSNSITVNPEDLSNSNSMYLLVGTYTVGESEGIYVYQFDTISGSSKQISSAKVGNPSFLTLSSDERFVYAVSENSDNSAAANAFSFDKKTGQLQAINTQMTGGSDPCYIATDKEGKHVITANYSGGSITLFNINTDGSLATASEVISFPGKGVDSERQKQSHLHCIKFSPEEKYMYACDLGTDKIHIFNVNKNSDQNFLKIANPAAINLKGGSGPRHLEFHPNGKHAYLINELSGAVTVFNYDQTNGNLNEVQSIQSDTLNAKGSADIHITPDGKFLYSSNRLKGDGLAIFSIDQTNGKLTKVGYMPTEAHPRNFVITPNGKYLLVASRDANMIQVFAIDKQTGLLENTFKDIKLDMPVCLKFASLQ